MCISDFDRKILIIDGLFEERLDNDANVKNKTKKCQVYLFLLELDKLNTKTLH